MPKSIIIIGAGIAGLSAGCFGQMNGYQTQIFELHDLPGGLCTAWKRKGYTIDGCIHWLMGTNPSSELNRLWRQLGALPGQGVIDHEEFVRIQDADGKSLIVYADVDRLEAHMKELAPGDAAVIEEFTKTVRRFSRVPMSSDKPRELMSTIDGLKYGLKMLPYLGDFKRGMSTTAGEYAQAVQRSVLAPRLPVGLRLTRPADDRVLYVSGQPECPGFRGVRVGGRWLLRRPSSAATASWAGRSTTMHGWPRYWLRTTRLAAVRVRLACAW